MPNKHEAWQFWYKEKGALLEESNVSTLRKMMEAYLAGYQAAQQNVQRTATPEPVCTCKVTAESYKNCDAHGNRRR